MNDRLEPQAEAKIFPMVGVGASAGGLEALTELLAKLPADSGLALLIVQHLDPSRPSLLSEILAKRTQMPVLEAVDDMVVAVGHVYVIPPDVSMTVAQGHLKLSPRAHALGPPMPVDDLFESLAKDQGANAFGIVLSGAGTDGAIGMQMIKSCGGITFAQDEATARFASMPRAAIGLGCVDLTLAPAAMAEELLRMVRHPYLAAGPFRAAAEGLHDDDGLRRLFRLLRNTCNVDFSHYKRGTVERRLSRRFAVHDLDALPAYLKVLESDPAEAHALCRDLLIRYTEFFRDPDAFGALAEMVFPRLLQAPDPSVPLRIWVPGCATGEEVYSIAMCLTEYMTSRSLTNVVQIFGTDISDDALETARAGRYIENIARNVSAERLNRFFVREGDYYRVVKSLRDCCTFARQNVAYDPPFSRIDLVSCRNLLIYLDPVLQKRVMPAFHFALQREGVLMLGLSESVGAYSELFSVLETKRAKLFTKKPVASRSFVAMTLPAQLPTTKDVPAERAPDSVPAAGSADSLRREYDRIVQARYTPASVVCDDSFTVLEFRGDTSPFLLHPPGVPTNQLQRLARSGVFLAVSEALRQVRSGGALVRRSGLAVDVDGQTRAASVEVVPLPPGKAEGRRFFVFFLLAEPAAAEPGSAQQATFAQALKSALLTRLTGRSRPANHDQMQQENARLAEELRATREQTRVMLDEYEGALEELKALEEETQSSNEEFQSTNEELETAKEELQSVNEELSTTNDELRFRNRELKGVHDEMARSRDYADVIIETMAQPLLVLDAELRVVRANHAFYSRFAVSAAESLHTRLYSLGSGQWDIPALRELLEELLPRRTVLRDYEVTAEFPHIGRRTLQLNAARIVASDPALIVLTIEDVTERDATLERLTTADRQKDEFLAMLGHELRNPLAAISSASHVLNHEKASVDTKRKAQAAMDRQLRNLVRMVEDLLDVSRITRGLVVLRPERFDLVTMVRQAADTLYERCAARRHQLTLSLPMYGMFVTGDSARLEQVTTNLIGNAIKYTPPGGRINVSLHREGPEVVLTVTDNGIGMTAELINKIFTVFVQAERNLEKSNESGLGIGLAIVRRLVQLHGGSVKAESAGPDQGSRFIVRLPEARAEAEPAADAPGESPGSPLQAPAGPTRRVLVVDDDIDAGESATALLTLEGHEVRLVHDGPSALKEAVDFNPEAVLLDIALGGGMDGYEVCRRLRQLAGLDGLLIIAISGFGQPEDIVRSRNAGFDHHLTKPANPQAVAELLRKGR